VTETEFGDGGRSPNYQEFNGDRPPSPNSVSVTQFRLRAGLFQECKNLAGPNLCGREGGCRRKKHRRRDNAVFDVDSQPAGCVEIPVELTDIDFQPIDTFIHTRLQWFLLKFARKRLAVITPLRAKLDHEGLVGSMGAAEGIVDRGPRPVLVVEPRDQQCGHQA
jgi:hypothetical protein